MVHHIPCDRAGQLLAERSEVIAISEHRYALPLSPEEEAREVILLHVDPLDLRPYHGFIELIPDEASFQLSDALIVHHRDGIPVLHRCQPGATERHQSDHPGDAQTYPHGAVELEIVRAIDDRPTTDDSQHQEDEVNAPYHVQVANDVPSPYDRRLRVLRSDLALQPHLPLFIMMEQQSSSAIADQPANGEDGCDEQSNHIFI